MKALKRFETLAARTAPFDPSSHALYSPAWCVRCPAAPPQAGVFRSCTGKSTTEHSAPPHRNRRRPKTRTPTEKLQWPREPEPGWRWRAVGWRWWVQWRCRPEWRRRGRAVSRRRWRRWLSSPPGGSAAVSGRTADLLAAAAAFDRNVQPLFGKFWVDRWINLVGEEKRKWGINRKGKGERGVTCQIGRHAKAACNTGVLILWHVYFGCICTWLCRASNLQVLK